MTLRSLTHICCGVLAAFAVATALPNGAAAAKPFQVQGMWIWYVSQAEGGNVSKIIAKARKNKVRTVFVKSSDGSSWCRSWRR